MRTRLVLALALAMLVGCAGGSHPRKASAYTVGSIKSGFRHDRRSRPGRHPGRRLRPRLAHHLHPARQHQTCRTYSAPTTSPARWRRPSKLPGGNSTGRIVRRSTRPGATPLPTVTQGALVFRRHARRPGHEYRAGGGRHCPDRSPSSRATRHRRDYKLNRGRSNWTAGRDSPNIVAHVLDDVDPETMTISSPSSCTGPTAILYVGYEQTKKTGERADSASKVKARCGPRRAPGLTKLWPKVRLPRIGRLNIPGHQWPALPWVSSDLDSRRRRRRTRRDRRPGDQSVDSSGRRRPASIARDHRRLGWFGRGPA